uniref:Ferroptosis suppressor protein 1 n=1 Tax=Phallusia mammillata TaxID=59560 RepID=A0A6F9D5I7_9ASCI|nr:apoptosis-inducing factor 2-like [Phallusia mammillata]
MGSGSSVPYQENMHVVVVGGGYCGALLAYKIKKSNLCKVTMIDPKDAMVHSIGALRCVVEEDFTKKIFLPYDQFIGDSFKRGKAVGLNTAQKEVTLEDGTTVSYTHLVIATGTRAPFPGKVTEAYPNVSTVDALKIYADYRTEVKNAKRVVLVGGGAVGVELSGEIKTTYPDKEVTLINSHDYFVSHRTSKGLQKKLIGVLNHKHITFMTGERVSNLSDLKLNEHVEGQVVKTESGKEVTADIVIPCTGTKLNNEFFKEALASSLTEHGALQVDEYLRVKGHEDIYAIGDINNSPEEKMTYTGQLQAKLFFNNFKAVASNGKLNPHKTASFMMVVPVGKDNGAGQLFGMVIGGTMVSKLKGHDLFHAQTWSGFGLKAPQ